MGRQGITKVELARRLHVSNQWVTRRVSTTSSVQLTLEEIVQIAGALGVPAERLLASVLPRLDSNQQPSGYPLSLVRGGASAAEGRIWWPDAAQPAPSGPKPRLVLVEAVAS
jgi:transcriptional regulator with XRE-family HTH domain